MARKTSNQTIEKIEKQIDHLKDETYVVDDITPILDSEVLKKNQEVTSSPKKKTTTKKVSSTGRSTKKTSTTKKSTTTTKKTTTTRKKTTTPREEIVVAPTKKTTKKTTTTTKNVRDNVVVADKPRTRKKKTTTAEIEDSIKKKNEELQESVEKIVDTIKEDNLDQEIANISLEEFVEVGTEVPVDLNNLEQEIEAIVKGEKDSPKEEQDILKDSTFIDESKTVLLDEELDFPFEIDKKKEEKESSKKEKLEDTVEILHSGETTELHDTIEKVQEDVEILHSGETADLDSVVKVTHYDDYDLEHLDQLDEYDIVGEFEKDILEETPVKKEEKKGSKKPIFPKIKKQKSIPEPSKDSYQNLEEDLRSLYDRVNDVVEDFDPNAIEDDFIDLTKLKSQTEVKTPPKKKFSFQTLKKNLLLKKDAFVRKLKSLRKKKQPVREIEILDEEYKPKKVRKDFEKLSKPRPEKRRKVRAYETEEYDNFSILDYISQRVLNFIMIFLAIIFILMCIAFVVFVVYVSTF